VTTLVRPAVPTDARRLARLHADRITEGFLPVLGERFLARLYRRISVSPHAFAHVAVDDATGRVEGFAAAATDVGALYREFARRDGLRAGLAAAPRLVRHAGRVLETLRYPSRTGGLPEAEILAVAVDPSSSGRGIGRRLVASVTDELVRRGAPGVKVVAGADNEAALRLYRACGFAAAASIALHEGVESEVLVWPAS
jgi:ribosomal protein S18 acetylase RimI-like enzyme